MSIMGTRVLRKEDPKFLTEGATYTADVRDPRLEGAAHVHFVRSTFAHAKINGIDASDAESMPGVLGVYTAEDIPEDVGTVPAAVPLFPPSMMNRPLLATGAARFAGDPVVAVVAETPVQAADAAEMVFVDYEPLPVAIDIEDADADNNVIFSDVGTNTAIDFGMMGMATGIGEEDIFADCDVVVKQRIVNHKTAPAPLEGRSVACVWDGGKLVVWLSSQAPHGFKGALTGVYGEGTECQVICPDVGGGFGQKIGGTPEELILPHLSRVHSRPMRWTETRTENLTGVGHGRAQVQHATIGGSKDGEIQAYRLEVIGDSGAYCGLGAFLPFFTHIMAAGVYKIPKIETTAKAVVTNTAPVLAYRGAGRPEATAAVERAIDIFAAECGLSPVDVRRKNFIPQEAFPYTTPHGTEYDSGAYETSLDKALEAADYESLLAEQASRRERGDSKQLGIGVAAYVEITGGPAPGGAEFARVRITPEGKAQIFSGAFSHGQSHATTFAMVAADQLGMDIDDIEVVQGDTDQVAEGTGTFASRSLQFGGSAVYDSSREVADQAREIAAKLLEADAEDVVLDTETGAFHVQGAPAVSQSWADVAAAAAEDGVALEHEGSHNANCSYPFGAHVVVAEVDTETGEVTVPKIITCDDSGTILNPNIMEGQRHGGIAQGIGQALTEEFVYDEDGNPVTSNFADYGFISAAELPSFTLVPLETPTPNNPLGAKGIGESGAIGSTPALQSAVVDALSHLGIRHIDIPLSPERVWNAIAAASSASN